VVVVWSPRACRKASETEKVRTSFGAKDFLTVEKNHTVRLLTRDFLSRLWRGSIPFKRLD
jgi:hypothetical protein